MKLKSIVIAISCLFLLGVSANVFAVSDSTGEPLTSGVDILSVSVVTSNQGISSPETAHLGVKMNSGSHLPAVVMFDFDVDNDTATGGGSVITGIPNMTCRDEFNNPQTCKADAGGGFDFHVTLLLRSQGDESSLGNCTGCSGSSNTCTERGVLHDCGTAGTCYELGDACQTGGDCYLVADRCGDTCSGIYTYPMTVLCDDAPAPSCNRGYVKGEWSVAFGQDGQVMNGNTKLALTYTATGETEICFELPWSIVLSESSTQIINAEDPEHLPFDVFYAMANPPKYQVTALHNLRFNTEDSEQDFTQPKLPGEPSGFYLAAKDWVPDTARVADGEFNEWDPCNHNSEGGYGDLDVDANDVTDFLNEFGRGAFFQPCPTCE